MTYHEYGIAVLILLDHEYPLGAFVKTKGNRESGANPERSRHCKRGVSFIMSLGVTPGKAKEATIRKPGDLPDGMHPDPFAERRGVRE
ncbi:hypothetical protein GCM10023310_45270 [Paenibacillus vulneris]